MSTSTSAQDVVTLPHGQASTSTDGRASPVPGPWRPSTRPGAATSAGSGRSSPAPSGNFPRDHNDHRGAASTGAWVSPSARAAGSNNLFSSMDHSSSRDQNDGSSSSGGNVGSRPTYGSPVRNNSYTTSSHRGFSSASSSSSALSMSLSPALAQEQGGATGGGGGSGSGPLKMGDLAAIFNSQDKDKGKFASLQLSPALGSSSGTFGGDSVNSSNSNSSKETIKRVPVGGFGSPVSPHMAHIKVQRTASLTHSPQVNPAPKGLGGKSPTSHLSQGTDMRRTASHNNTFTSGLGSPLLPSSGAHLDPNGAGHMGGSHVNGISSGSNAPFSLGVLPRSSPRRSSLNPQDSNSSTHHGDHTSTSFPSPLMADKHPLQHPWTLYFDTTTGYNRPGSSLYNFENGLRELGSFTTVELFARYFNWIEKPHKIENNSNYHLFKDGIKPMWEDPANTKGGRWILTLLNKNPDVLDRCWMELAYALVGEQLDARDDVCGAVLSRRTKADRLAVWIRDKDNVEAVNGIGKRLVGLLDLAKEKISLEFQITSEGRSSNAVKSYITLEIIRNELAAESLARSDATPSLWPDCAVTPVSATSSSSPVTPADLEIELSGSGVTIKVEGISGEEGSTSSSSSSGLLISMDGDKALHAQTKT
ncbi:hypothetical protein BGZ83_002675 [Gryganskiella cystojenkinii]|nr:hypothetical protein BGZ83_002675 [Gryganskiella cystojenkinii]